MLEWVTISKETEQAVLHATYVVIAYWDLKIFLNLFLILVD